MAVREYFLDYDDVGITYAAFQRFWGQLLEKDGGYELVGVSNRLQRYDRAVVEYIIECRWFSNFHDRIERYPRALIRSHTVPVRGGQILSLQLYRQSTNPELDDPSLRPKLSDQQVVDIFDSFYAYLGNEGYLDWQSHGQKHSEDGMGKRHGGLPRNAEDDWACRQVWEKGHERRQVYLEWRERIGDRLKDLGDPRDSFEKATSKTRWEKLEGKMGENRVTESPNLRHGVSEILEIIRKIDGQLEDLENLWEDYKDQPEIGIGARNLWRRHTHEILHEFDPEEARLFLNCYGLPYSAIEDKAERERKIFESEYRAYKGFLATLRGNYKKRLDFQPAEERAGEQPRKPPGLPHEKVIYVPKRPEILTKWKKAYPIIKQTIRAKQEEYRQELGWGDADLPTWDDYVAAIRDAGVNYGEKNIKRIIKAGDAGLLK